MGGVRCEVGELVGQRLISTKSKDSFRLLSHSLAKMAPINGRNLIFGPFV